MERRCKVTERLRGRKEKFSCEERTTRERTNPSLPLFPELSSLLFLSAFGLSGYRASRSHSVVWGARVFAPHIRGQTFEFFLANLKLFASQIAKSGSINFWNVHEPTGHLRYADPRNTWKPRQPVSSIRVSSLIVFLFFFGLPVWLFVRCFFDGFDLLSLISRAATGPTANLRCARQERKKKW